LNTNLLSLKHKIINVEPKTHCVPGSHLEWCPIRSNTHLLTPKFKISIYFAGFGHYLIPIHLKARLRCKILENEWGAITIYKPYGRVCSRYNASLFFILYVCCVKQNWCLFDLFIAYGKIKRKCLPNTRTSYIYNR